MRDVGLVEPGAQQGGGFAREVDNLAPSLAVGHGAAYEQRGIAADLLDHIGDPLVASSERRGIAS